LLFDFRFDLRSKVDLRDYREIIKFLCCDML
jgi:hypothetical protein